MGQKMTEQEAGVHFEVYRMLVPDEYLKHFVIVGVKEGSEEWLIILHEKEHLIPGALKEEPDVVLDGFCNPVHILSHGFSLKPIFLVMRRRRWKLSCTNKHYSNDYELTKTPTKVTPAMWGFLKSKIEQRPITIICVARMFGLKAKTLHHWYQNDFSGYEPAKESGLWGKKKIIVVDEATGEVVKEKPVHIAKAENMGTHMTIDEKQIGKKMYTIMTHSTSGKIAFLAETLKPSELKQAFNNYLAQTTEKVLSISCDMSPSYKKFCQDEFPNTQLVIDKFHVIKHLMDALHQVRKKIKTECINTPSLKQEKQENNKSQEKMWSMMERLDRSRYILCKMQNEWESDEIEIIKPLFAQFPTLETAYLLSQKLRNWYNGRNIGKNLIAIERELQAWYDQVDQAKLPAFNAIRKMMERHQDTIINYFKEGQTNAKAENMNSKIQRFLSNNYGIKNRDFFFYRVAGYFS